MKNYSILEGKRILIVDDELDMLEEFLPGCDFTKSTSFDNAKALLETVDYDLAILNIMGVNGFELLEIANERKILAIIPKAHTFTPESTIKAYKNGAAFFIPKEQFPNITTFLSYVFSAKEKGGNYWSNWINSFEPIHDAKFGPAWKDNDSDFWGALAKREWRLASTLRDAESLI